MCHPSLHRGENGVVKARSSLCGGGAEPALSGAEGPRWDGAEPRHHTMHGAEPFVPLGRHPVLLAPSFHYESAILELQPIEEFTPVSCNLRGVFLRAES